MANPLTDLIVRTETLGGDFIAIEDARKEILRRAMLREDDVYERVVVLEKKLEMLTDRVAVLEGLLFPEPEPPPEPDDPDADDDDSLPDGDGDVIPDTGGPAIALPYTRVFDAQERIAIWGSAGGAHTAVCEEVAGRKCLKWIVTPEAPFGKFHSQRLAIPTTGIVDVDVWMYFPQSCVDYAKLPSFNGRVDKGAVPPEGDYKVFPGSKLFRMFPLKQSGHNCTLFGRYGSHVYLRDFKGDKVKVLNPKTGRIEDAHKQTDTPMPIDKWCCYRIRNDYDAGTVGLWIDYQDGKGFVESATVACDHEPTGYVGPILHATNRDEQHTNGRHKPFWIGYGGYVVTARKGA